MFPSSSSSTLTTATTGGSSQRHVVAVPYPGRGHINPMLNLCRLLLSSSKLTISFVITEEWLSLLFPTTTTPPNLRLLTIPNVIPSEHVRSRDFAGFIEAVYTRMEEPFERLIEGLNPPPDAIVADTYLPWAVTLGNRRNIPVCSLWTMSASFFSALYHLHRIPTSPPLAVAGEADEPLAKYIPGHNSTMVSDLHGILTSVTCDTQKRALEALSMVKKAHCVLFTSFYELEAQVIDVLRRDLPCPVYPVGPSIPYMMLDEKQPSDHSTYIEWLNTQSKQSVLYISLGSFLSVSAVQMDEIAMGLRLSGVRFLWVARGDSSRLHEMVGSSMGLVVPWCDQLRVLNHPCIGGFLTHCGWNSTLEAAFCGVPMLTFPIFWDQLINSRLIVDEWKVGLSLRGEVGRDCVVGREGIALIVKKLMALDGVESKEMMRRAVGLRDATHAAIEAGGSSLVNLDSFVSSIA